MKVLIRAIDDWRVKEKKANRVIVVNFVTVEVLPLVLGL